MSRMGKTFAPRLLLPDGEECACARYYGTDAWHEHDHTECQDANANANAADAAAEAQAGDDHGSRP